MEKILRIVVCLGLLAVLATSGCAAGSLERIARHAVTGSPTGSWTGGSFYAPQAGLLIMENPNPAVWAEAFLLKGYFGKRSVFTFNPNNPSQIIFVVKPMAYIRMAAPISRDKSSVLDLRSFGQKILPPYRARYTLVVFHRNLWWQMVGEPEVKNFWIDGHPFGDKFKHNGRVVMCDEYIKLGRRNAYEKTYLRLNLKIALRDYISW